jgi:hypothetical protein
MYTTTINGVKVNITKSNKQFKKLRAQFVNPETGKLNTIHFGDNRYTHYRDKSGIWKHKDTMDPTRRELYRKRHAKDLDTDEQITAGILSWNILW